MDWDKFLKKYVWDDEKTPYFVAAGRLSRRQADHEVNAYALFLGTLFAVVAITSLSERAPQGRSLGVSFYGVTMVCSAIVLAATKHYYAALLCGTAPLAVLAYFFLYRFAPGLETVDRIVIAGFSLLWLRYSMRVVAIARAYPEMPEPDD